MKCANTPCEREATCYYVTRGGVRFHLCDICRDAFLLGQGNVGAELGDVDDNDDDLDGLTWPKEEEDE